MKRLLLAAAAAPLLIACTTAAASEMNTAERDGEARVLLINGERIEIGEGGNARAALTAALEGGPGEAHAPHDWDFDFEFDGTEWSPQDRAEFEAAMEELAESLAGLEREMAVLSNIDDERVRVRIAEIERFHEEHGERIEAHAERMAVRAERMAERAEIHGERMRVVGLSAGLRGMESGLAGIDRALERGWVREDGERRELTEEEREELREARAELAENLEEFRAEHAQTLSLLENEGERRVYLRRLRADAPAAPEAPPAPELEGGD